MRTYKNIIYSYTDLFQLSFSKRLLKFCNLSVIHDSVNISVKNKIQQIWLEQTLTQSYHFIVTKTFEDQIYD